MKGGQGEGDGKRGGVGGDVCFIGFREGVHAPGKIR